jgi:hypothetical protein
VYIDKPDCVIDTSLVLDLPLAVTDALIVTVLDEVVVLLLNVNTPVEVFKVP